MLLLILILGFCHFLGDFTHLSTAWMLNAKLFGKPALPIMAHAAVHATLMGIVLAFWCHAYHPIPTLTFWFVVVLQLVSHYSFDTLKGLLNDCFPSLLNPGNKFTWYVFGLDQFLHFFIIVDMVNIVYNGLK